MRIAIFADYYLPSIGGVQTAISHQKRALEARGHEVIIVTVDYPEWRDREDFLLLPSPIKLKQGTNTMRGFVPMPGIERRVANHLRAWGVDIIHIETEFIVGGLGYRVAKRLHVPCIYTIHTLIWRQSEIVDMKFVGFFALLTRVALALYFPWKVRPIPRLDDESYEHFVFRRLAISFAEAATMVISPSQHLKNTLVGWGVDTPIVVQPNFCDITPDRQPLPDIPVFLWAGRLDTEKRPLDFLDALLLLEKRCSPDSFRVMIVGSGEHHDTIAKRIGNRSWLIHLGPVPYDEMPVYIDKSSVLVMTSQDFDNQPMVIAEAVLHGRGVVVVDKNLQEGLGGGAGLWPTGTRPEDLAASLQQVVENHSIAQQMSDAAWRNRVLFTAQNGAIALETVYKKAIRRFNGH